MLSGDVVIRVKVPRSSDLDVVLGALERAFDNLKDTIGATYEITSLNLEKEKK